MLLQRVCWLVEQPPALPSSLPLIPGLGGFNWRGASVHATVKSLLWVCRGASGQQKPEGGRSAGTTMSLLELVWPLSKLWVLQGLASPPSLIFQIRSLPAQIEALLISASSVSARCCPSPASLQAAFGFSSDGRGRLQQGHPCGRASFSLFPPHHLHGVCRSQDGCAPSPQQCKAER